MDRNIWTFLDVFYQRGERDLLRLPRRIAPIEVGVFPLLSKDDLPGMAMEVYHSIKDDFACFYDESGSIGKRYARMDEIGTPFCMTIDHDSLKQKDVTVRDRDTTQQKRVNVSELPGMLTELLRKGKW